MIKKFCYYAIGRNTFANKNYLESIGYTKDDGFCEDKSIIRITPDGKFKSIGYKEVEISNEIYCLDDDYNFRQLASVKY